MPSYPAYLIDAFTSDRFAGNQAAVCLIPQTLSDELYQKLGAEFNLSETAFPQPKNGDFKTASRFSLRWFTPSKEINLCGHATLATAHVLLNIIENVNDTITFSTKSGDLIVSRSLNGQIRMDFPQYELKSLKVNGITNSTAERFTELPAPDFVRDIVEALVPPSIKVQGLVYAPVAKKVFVLIDPSTTREQFGQLKKNYKEMHEKDINGTFVMGVGVTFAPTDAKSQGWTDIKGIPYDYVCRFFVPWYAVNEDPATGSAQCGFAPVWAKLLGRKELYGYQAFPNRGAQFNCKLVDNGRLHITGSTITVLHGEVEIDH